MNINWKGWRTVGYGLAVAIAPAALQYLVGIDWTKLIGPSAALALSGIGTIVMRAITNTSLGKSS